MMHEPRRSAAVDCNRLQSTAINTAPDPRAALARLHMLAPLLALLLPAAATADGYPNGWRGDGTGYWRDANVPVEWDGPSGRNIRWKIQLPTRGSNPGPVFGPGRVLVTSEPDFIQCFSTADGKLLWQDRFSAIDLVAPEADQAELEAKLYEGFCLSFGHDPKDTLKSSDPAEAGKKGRGPALLREVRSKVPMRDYPMAWDEIGFASHMPVATKDRVVVRHGSNAMACYDWDGKRLWTVQPTPRNFTQHAKNPMLEVGAAVIVESGKSGPDMVICTFTPDAEYMGMSVQEYKEKKYPDGNHTGDGKGWPGVEALVAFDLATGKELWRSKAVRSDNIRSQPLVKAQVGGEPVILTGGGCVVRARDGEVVLRDLGWGGYGGSPGAYSDADAGTAYVAYNEGSRRWSPRDPNPGHHVYVYRLARDGEEIKAERLWEWGYEGPKGFSPRAPVVLEDLVIAQGNGCLIFSLKDGRILCGPKEASSKAEKAYTREAQKMGLRNPSKSNCYQNPVVVGRNLYLISKDGSVLVTALEGDAAAGVKPRQLHHNRLDPEDARAGRSKKDMEQMGRWTLSDPVVWENNFYIRQNSWLWCVGKK